MKSLSRLALPKVFSVLTLSLALASGLNAADVDARTLNFSTPAPPTDRPTNDALLWWADEVEKRTEGSVSIKIHWLQSLVKYMRIPANVTGHSGDRDRFAHGHHAGVDFVL
ncbi:hypothetical protein C7H09_05310 [Marinobacter fuscus]|uniref:Uncharacterized protein n=1 Tax=Marinobacter fuscus TaxID=2109942 RepID=A0A2T1KPF5_9GAMM|nr:hypothetical protein [Marinobacter fuscus]PSF11975.1 hypothetical protein C7H09_05310 [Marinobacter fuscus]